MFTLETKDDLKSLNGENTLGENMADFGGLVTAYDIFVEKKIKEGYAGEEFIRQKKMFFQSFAIGWTNVDDEDFLAWRIENDEHAPGSFRVNGNVCQIDDWYELYNVQKSDRYYLDPSQRVILW